MFGLKICSSPVNEIQVSLKELARESFILSSRQFAPGLSEQIEHLCQQNQKLVSRYLEDWLEWSHQQRKMQAANPHPAAERWRKLKAERPRQAVALLDC